MDINIKEMPDSITVKVYPVVHATYGWLSLLDSPPAEHGDYIGIGDPVEVTFKLGSREDAMNDVISKLKKEQSEIRVESERKCMGLEEKIQQLLALPESV